MSKHRCSTPSQDTSAPSVDELPSAGKHANGSGSRPGYVIEVRSSFDTPTIIGDFVIDSKWREWRVRRGGEPFAANILIKPWDNEMLDHCGLLPYVAAEAHRWALLAFLEASHAVGSLCIETRLVEVMYKYSFSGEEVGVGPTMGADSWGFSRRELKFSPRFVPPTGPVNQGSAPNTDATTTTTEGS